jgi:hypothetical protein
LCLEHSRDGLALAWARTGRPSIARQDPFYGSITTSNHNVINKLSIHNHFIIIPKRFSAISWAATPAYCNIVWNQPMRGDLAAAVYFAPVGRNRQRRKAPAMWMPGLVPVVTRTSLKPTVRARADLCTALTLRIGGRLQESQQLLPRTLGPLLHDGRARTAKFLQR